MNILFFRISESSFINNDIEILRSHHNVDVYDFTMQKGYGLLGSLRRQYDHMRKYAGRYDLLFSWFADYHTLIPAMLKGKARLITVAGGYDADEILAGLEPGMKGRLRRAIVRYTFRRSDAIAPVSKTIEGCLRTSGISGNIKLIFNGVDVSRFGAGAIGKKKNVILTTGGSASMKELKRKRLDFFVSVAERFSAAYPQFEAKFVMTGHNPGTETFEYLSGLIRSKNIDLLPRISSEELAELYRNASVYLQPSLYEGFGIAIAEAMLNGCVVIANRGGSIPEVVGDAGILATRFDEDLYVEYIKECLEGKFDGLRSHARDRISENYSLDRRKKELLALADSLASAG